MNINSDLEKEFRLTLIQKNALKKLGLIKIKDLLYHFPTRYGDTKEIKYIRDLKKGDFAVIFGKISNLKTGKAFIKKIPMSDAILYDDTEKIKLVWFNQPYIVKMLKENAMVRVEGKVSVRKEHLYISNPKIEIVNKLPNAVGNSLFGKKITDDHTLYPVYPESKGITSLWFYHAIQKIFNSETLDSIQDPIPEYILKKYNLPNIKTAFIWIHAPKKQEHSASARKRFAFQEIFFIQIQKQKDKKIWATKSGWSIETSKKDIKDFINRFPFKPTKSQISAIESITSDFKRGYPMSRLLEGDVGSGKTAVAATTIYAITKSRPTNESGEQISGNLQTAYMVPTEILAKQHYENFISYFSHLPIKIGLVTGSECRIFPSKNDSTKSVKIGKNQLLKWVANGEVPILIGTHAIIQKTVSFKHLAYAVIDEQHRFGTIQRQKITTKNTKTPHLLSMTATPIPRTLSLTLYGDLDLTILEGMPHGRKPIITKVILPNTRNETYNEIRKELKNGRQLYVICPRIDEPDPTKEMAILAKSVKLEAERLSNEVFPEFMIDILHSKMTPQEKEETMKAFEQGETQILVATSVVEVGVNVPNATMIIIEGAERFGLSQLHQLRGRVIRSNHQAYCYIFPESNSVKTKDRMKALLTAKNGFELAEFDLQQRGAGELYGKKQWGIGDVAMEAIKNIKMVEASRTEAVKIIEEDISLNKYPEIKEYLENEVKKIHFE